MCCREDKNAGAVYASIFLRVMNRGCRSVVSVSGEGVFVHIDNFRVLPPLKQDQHSLRACSNMQIILGSVEGICTARAQTCLLMHEILFESDLTAHRCLRRLYLQGRSYDVSAHAFTLRSHTAILMSILSRVSYSFDKTFMPMSVLSDALATSDPHLQCRSAVRGTKDDDMWDEDWSNEVCAPSVHVLAMSLDSHLSGRDEGVWEEKWSYEVYAPS